MCVCVCFQPTVNLKFEDTVGTVPDASMESREKHYWTSPVLRSIVARLFVFGKVIVRRVLIVQQVADFQTEELQGNI